MTETLKLGLYMKKDTTPAGGLGIFSGGFSAGGGFGAGIGAGLLGGAATSGGSGACKNNQDNSSSFCFSSVFGMR